MPIPTRRIAQDRATPPTHTANRSTLIRAAVVGAVETPTIRLPVPDLFAGMNGTERRRGVELEALKRDGQIALWRFEAVTLKLAPDCRYTPDFYVLHNDGRVVLEETKGHWRDDAKVKIRVAARLFPEFEFRALRLERGQWQPEEYRAV